ncbi:MAG: cysteine hydrolase [Roseivirga sp.]|nr:cysteine hydrolase [Roseivirga sp.]
MIKDKKPALILIDLQKGWEDTAHWGGNRNNPDAEQKAVKLLELWREQGLPVFHVIHSSREEGSRLHPDHPGFAMIDEITPTADEPVIVKEVNSGFIGTDLKERLEAQEITTLVIAGLTTNHCVSTTTRMAGNFGFQVYLISDATATFDRKGLNGELFEAELVHQTALASLNEEFARVIDYGKLMKLF